MGGFLHQPSGPSSRQLRLQCGTCTLQRLKRGWIRRGGEQLINQRNPTTDLSARPGHGRHRTPHEVVAILDVNACQRGSDVGPCGVGYLIRTRLVDQGGAGFGILQRHLRQGPQRKIANTDGGSSCGTRSYSLSIPQEPSAPVKTAFRIRPTRSSARRC